MRRLTKSTIKKSVLTFFIVNLRIITTNISEENELFGENCNVPVNTIHYI